MFCTKCSQDRFTTIKVFREKRLKDGKWFNSNNHDTRLVVCRNCGRRYYVESVITYSLVFNSEANRSNLQKHTPELF